MMLMSESQNMINDMAREMARLANDAKGRKEQKRIETVGIGRGRQAHHRLLARQAGIEQEAGGRAHPVRDADGLVGRHHGLRVGGIGQ